MQLDNPNEMEMDTLRNQRGFIVSCIASHQRAVVGATFRVICQTRVQLGPSLTDGPGYMVDRRL